IPNPTITVDETAEYIVTATNNADCSAIDTVMVELLFESFTLGDDIILCEGESVTIATGYDNTIDHDWSTNETSTEIEVSQNGIYEVVVTSPEGCTDSDEIEVTMQALPIVDLGIDPGLCEGEVHPLDAGNPGMDYEWNTTAVTQSINATTSGTYSVVVTDQYDCVGTDQIDLVFNQNPVLNLPESITICEDEFTTLDAENPGSVFVWNTTENTQMIDVNLPGDYSVTVTNVFNCSSSDNTTLTTATYPIVFLGDDQASCAGETITLDAGNPGLNYNWSTGDTTQTADVFTTGIYTVQVDNNYCYTSDQVSLVFNPLPIDPMFADTTLCFQDSPYGMYLTAGNEGSTFQWNNGSTDQNIFANSPGYTTVSVTTANGCSSTFGILIDELCLGDYIYVPNAFTPNSDGINDVFQVKGTAVETYEITIWNRWGQKVYQSDDMDEIWEGDFQNGEHYVQSEAYVYQINYKYFDEQSGEVSDWVTLDGFVSVIR
ncbi:MAG: gliding motility-associated C-terminal domain-containing protein, partial [Flavobacteriales bacterium]